MALNKVYNALDHTFFVDIVNKGTDAVEKTFACEGESDSDFIAVSITDDAVISATGAKGSVQWSIKQAKVGTIVFTGQWGSSSNPVLNKIYNRQQRGEIYVKGRVVRSNDTTGEDTTLHNSRRGFINKPADNIFGAEASDRGWTFNLEDLTFLEEADPV